VKIATIYIVKKGTKFMPPISKSGFLLGALLAAAAAVVKIVVLDAIDRRAGRTVS
jgi:hydroxyethylthiazole kinase-like sugar kinase family protein